MFVNWKKVTRVAVAAIVLLSLSSDSIAQENRDARPGDRNASRSDGGAFLEKAGLKIGDNLPEAAGYDINGKPFALQDIKGSHAVIVFGCMT